MKDSFSLGTRVVGGFRKRVPLPLRDGQAEQGFTTIPQPDREFAFEVEIDWDKLLHHLGAKAAHKAERGKIGKAAAIHGAIKLTARLNREV